MKEKENFIKRIERKEEHIDFFLQSKNSNTNLFEDVYLEHNALPELNLSDIDTKCVFLGQTIDYPIIINAITGGTEFSKEINMQLSKIAKELNIPIAVGSQTISLYNKKNRDSFEIVREIIGEHGVVLANLSAKASLEEVNIALEMVKGNGIQLHLNSAQELAMKEGDRDFRGTLENIEYIVSNIDKPVIVKEVGFGISNKVAKKLYSAGVRYVDISGSGGTNFIEIEDMRTETINFSDIYSWGVPTALSLLQCRKVEKDLTLISSGGIKNSQEIVKSLVLGASMVGMSGEVLRCLLEEGYETTLEYLKGTLYKVRMLMLLLGKKTVKELRDTPFKIKGELKELI